MESSICNFRSSIIEIGQNTTRLSVFIQSIGCKKEFAIEKQDNHQLSKGYEEKVVFITRRIPSLYHLIRSDNYVLQLTTLQLGIFMSAQMDGG